MSAIGPDCNEARTVEVLELVEDRWVIVGNHDDTATARLPPFDAVEVAIDRLFLPRAVEPDSGR